MSTEDQEPFWIKSMSEQRRLANRPQSVFIRDAPVFGEADNITGRMVAVPDDDKSGFAGVAAFMTIRGMPPDPPIPCIPCGARLLVIRDEAPEQVGSIILAEKSRPASGVVRMAGPMAPKEFAPGVRVLFGEYAGTVAKIGEAVVLILDPSEVIAFVQEPAIAAG